ncbi:hypothetical protein EYZ11_002271 [Aspergillus tanneri]|uniref:Cofilin n=1 Tax=Aspergillus tanneri TaxID=1220188 RepID=A0A4S3JR85_9EURO|nr:hypothetical protein EYZ11_002271 [Aspergillus tanneri]
MPVHFYFLTKQTHVTIADECLHVFRDLYNVRSRNKLNFVIFKTTDDERTVVVEEASSEPEYEVFRQKITRRWTVKDNHFQDTGARTVFVTWVPENASMKLCMLYASTTEQLKNALNIKVATHADIVDDLKWKTMLTAASGGKA